MDTFDALVTIQRSGALGARYDFSERSWCSVGSHQDCDIRILSKGVAVLHALITITEGEEPLIYGLDEILPVLIPERNISLCNSMFATLLHGDVFFAGERAFRFERANGPPLPAPDVPASALVASNSENPQCFEPKPVPEPIADTPLDSRARRKARRSRKSMVVSDFNETFVNMPKSGPLIKRTRFTLTAGEIAGQLIKDRALPAATPFKDIPVGPKARKSMPVFSGSFGNIAVTYEQPADADQKHVRDRLNLMSARKKKKKHSARSKRNEVEQSAMDENEPPKTPRTSKVHDNQEKQSIGIDVFYASSPLKTPHQIPSLRKSKSAARTLVSNPTELDNTPTRLSSPLNAAETNLTNIEHDSKAPSRRLSATLESTKTPVRTSAAIDMPAANVFSAAPKTLSHTPGRLAHAYHKTPVHTPHVDMPTIATTLTGALYPSKLATESDTEMTEDDTVLAFASPKKPSLEQISESPLVNIECKPRAELNLSEGLIETPQKTQQLSASSMMKTPRKSYSARRLPRPPTVTAANQLTPRRHPEVQTRRLATPLRTSSNLETPSRLNAYATPRRTNSGPAIKKLRLPPRERLDDEEEFVPCTPRSAIRPPRRFSEAERKATASATAKSSRVGLPRRLSQAVRSTVVSESPRVGPPRRVSRAQSNAKPEPGFVRRLSCAQRLSVASVAHSTNDTPMKKDKPGPPMRLSVVERDAREVALASTPKIRPAQRASQISEPDKLAFLRPDNIFAFSATKSGLVPNRRTAVTPTSGTRTADKMRARRSARSNKTMLRTPTVDTYASKLPTLKSPSVRSPSPAKPTVNQFVAKTPGARLPFLAASRTPRARSPRYAKSPTFKATVTESMFHQSPMANMISVQDDEQELPFHVQHTVVPETNPPLVKISDFSITGIEAEDPSKMAQDRTVPDVTENVADPQVQITVPFIANDGSENMKAADELEIAVHSKSLDISKSTVAENDVDPANSNNRNSTVSKDNDDGLFKNQFCKQASSESCDEEDVVSLLDNFKSAAFEKTALEEPEIVAEAMGISSLKTSDSDVSTYGATKRVVEVQSPTQSLYTTNRPRDMPELCSSRRVEPLQLSVVRTPRLNRKSLGVASKTISKIHTRNPRTPAKVAFSGFELEKGPHYSPRARSNTSLLFPPSLDNFADVTSPNSPPLRHPAEAEREQRELPGAAPSSALAKLGSFFFTSKPSPVKEVAVQPTNEAESSEDEDYTPERDEEVEDADSSVISLSSGSAMSVASASEYDSEGSDVIESEESENEADTGNGQTSLSTDHTPRRLSLGERISALFYGAHAVAERPESTGPNTPSDCDAPTRTSASSEPASEVDSVPGSQSERDEELQIEFECKEPVNIEEKREEQDDVDKVFRDEEDIEEEEESGDEEDSDNVEVSPPRRRSLIGRAISAAAVVLATVSPARSLLRFGSGLRQSADSEESSSDMEIDDASPGIVPGDLDMNDGEPSPLSEPSAPCDATSPHVTLSASKSIMPLQVTPDKSAVPETRETASNLMNRFNDESVEGMIDPALLIDQKQVPAHASGLEIEMEAKNVETDPVKAEKTEPMDSESSNDDQDIPVTESNFVNAAGMDITAGESENNSMEDGNVDEAEHKIENPSATEEFNDDSNVDTIKSLKNTSYLTIQKEYSASPTPRRIEEQPAAEAEPPSEADNNTLPPSPQSTSAREPTTTEPTVPTDYSKWTVKELRQYLNGLDVSLGKGLKKADLIVVAQKADGSFVEIEQDSEDNISESESEQDRIATEKKISLPEPIDSKQDVESESETSQKSTDDFSVSEPEGDDEDEERKDDLRALLSSRKVPYLRGLLRKCDIDDKGRKADLVETLLAESFSKVMAFIDEDDAPAVQDKADTSRSSRKKLSSPRKQAEKVDKDIDDEQTIEDNEMTENVVESQELRRNELKALTVKKLQVLLGKLKLDKAGRKDVLIERIVKAEFNMNNVADGLSDKDEEMAEEPTTPSPKPAHQPSRATRSTAKKVPPKNGTDVGRMTVAQLRKYLRAQGRCTNGLKSALLARAEDEQADLRRRRKFKDDFLCAGCREDEPCSGPK